MLTMRHPGEKMKRKIEELEQWRNVALAVTSPQNGKIVTSHQKRRSAAGNSSVSRKNRFPQSTDQGQQKEAIPSGPVRPPDDGLREIASVCNTEALDDMDNLFPFDWSFRDDSAVSLCDYRTDSGTDRDRKSSHDRSLIDGVEGPSRDHSIGKSVNLAFEDGSTQAQDYNTSRFEELEVSE
ncbi:hypothetical protein K458DRAFT_114604 [Lentithecium fluviatile CBS 122367]|uniref:Uncharacterized protein n=1 Tax=Lentithecium fluviatile CBS 122367 TaxID=1168545 RepID=A0A6G1IMT1_9PLEO|nr:hypothetical protein K458DRAFT_114604 [Lentithecium fluviatile CBS 122367]